MNDVIKELENASGPSAELDILIAESVDRPMKAMDYLRTPAFTASVDAAMKLIPDGFITLHAGEQHGGKWFWGLHMDAGHPNNPTTKDGCSFAYQTDSRPSLFADGAANAAIAICIAALKARSALTASKQA